MMRIATSPSIYPVQCAGAVVEALQCRMLLSATLAQLASFPSGAITPSTLISDGSGDFYGTAAGVGPTESAATIFEVPAGSHTPIMLFTQPATAGPVPALKLLVDGAGTLYGWDADYNNAETDLQPASGQVFELPAGAHSLTTLASFPLYDEPSDLILDPVGNLFGSTASELFEITAGTHAFKRLATFQSDDVDPGGFVLDANGNLYGTSAGLGMGVAANYGTVFEVPAGTEQVVTVATFNGKLAGEPTANLVCDASGNVYGLEGDGGRYDDGSVFEVAAGTRKPVTLASFDGADGVDPNLLVLGPDGDLYGTTILGGPSGQGSVFQLIPATGDLTALASPETSTQSPGSLIFDAAGNLFGAAVPLPGNTDGQIFQIHAGSEALTTVFSFTGENAGGPLSAIYADAAGNLFGESQVGQAGDESAQLYELSGSGFVVGQAAPTVFQQPVSKAALSGGGASFTTVANSTPTPTVRWQASTDGGKTFTDITGNASATTQTLTLTDLTPSQNGTKYRAIFTNNPGSVTTDVVKLAVEPLVLVSPAHASPSTVAGTTTTLSALADATGADTVLTYKWSFIRIPAGAAKPTFSTNNSSAARHTVVTFHKDGRYLFRCAITDGLGDIVKSDVQVEVTQQATSLRLTSHDKTITTGQNLAFHAALYDQFGHPMRTQPAAAYSILNGPGTINASSGIFSSTTSGAALIQAEEGDFFGTAGLQVIP